ncbi:Thrombomodulin [Camelus dromedarius]|uniref:Thrombomodulin n=1 Tax=Camelus dromedarius TaxID=9838 RepID=A0A5N4CTL8_CAMDR|nr:Thrombomodulin [Camelus dromedarius]
MLRVLFLGVLAPAGLGLPAPLQPRPLGSQCIERDCFALFQGPATFLAASQACERLQGHLMTVRSSVAAEVISLLLSGGGLRLWIGLQLPPGCGDPGHHGPLRGFQWVTGDNRTSYSKWARPHSDGAPLCGPLCVAISAAGDPAPMEPAWEEQQCGAEADGFLCELHYAASCRPLAVEPGAAAAGVTVTYSTPFGDRGADFQALPVGSSAAVAPLGLELECAAPPGEAEGRWVRETPGAWACSVESGGCQHGCNESAGESRCLCPADAPLQADGRSCAEPAQHPCHQLCQQFCVPGPPDAPTNYTCMCATGYRLAADQHQCEDVDDCMQVPSPCPQNCVNEQGSFRCNCYPGYEQQDGECVELQDPCFGNKCEYECQPVGRSEHRCVCAEGFVPNSRLYECVCGPDSVLAGQIATDCDPVKVGGDRTEERTEDGGSGEPPGSTAPRRRQPPPRPEPLHSGVLVGISIASLSLVVALLALLCHLRKKQGASLAEPEYKCGAPGKEAVLPREGAERTPQRL